PLAVGDWEDGLQARLVRADLERGDGRFRAAARPRMDGADRHGRVPAGIQAQAPASDLDGENPVEYVEAFGVAMAVREEPVAERFAKLDALQARPLSRSCTRTGCTRS